MAYIVMIVLESVEPDSLGARGSEGFTKCAPPCRTVWPPWSGHVI